MHLEYVCVNDSLSTITKAIAFVAAVTKGKDPFIRLSVVDSRSQQRFALTETIEATRSRIERRSWAEHHRLDEELKLEDPIKRCWCGKTVYRLTSSRLGHNLNMALMQQRRSSHWLSWAGTPPALRGFLHRTAGSRTQASFKNTFVNAAMFSRDPGFGRLDLVCRGKLYHGHLSLNQWCKSEYCTE